MKSKRKLNKAFASGIIKPGDILTNVKGGKCMVLFEEKGFMLENAKVFKSLSRAAIVANKNSGGESDSLNGWAYWHQNDKKLFELYDGI